MPRPLRPGESPAARELNDQWRRTADAALPTGASGFLGIDAGIGGATVVDGRPARPLARITSRGVGANYGWHQVIDKGDGTYADQPLISETAWGTPTAGPAWELAGRTDVPTDGTVLVELVPGQQDAANWYFRYDGPGTGSDGGEDAASGGYGVLLGMGEADCVEFSSPGGQGRCSPVLPFAIKGAWSGEREWTAGGTVPTALGAMALVFTSLDDTPVLVGTFSGGSAPASVAFKLVSVGSHCAIFVTTDRRICTAAPGGPCEANALVVSVCCVPCVSLVVTSCDPPAFDLVTAVCGEGTECFPSGFAGSVGGDLTSTAAATCDGYSVSVQLAWNADRTALVATLLYTPGMGAPTVLGYEAVTVLSWLPFHATVTTTAAYTYVGAAGTVFTLWQRNDDGSGAPYTCANVGPQAQVTCAECPTGAAPAGWTLDACCLVTQTSTGSRSDTKPTLVYQGGCTWTTKVSAGGDGYTITISGGKIRLEFPPSGGPSFNQSYEADVPASCCEPIELTRVNDIAATAHTEGLGPVCLPRFPEGSTIEWPDTITIIPYGDCDGPGPGPGGGDCGISGCPDGASDTYKFTVGPGTTAFAGADGSWSVPFGGGVWTYSQGGWTATYVPGSPGTLTLSRDSDPTGVYVVFAVTLDAGCCGTLTGYTVVDSAGAGGLPSLDGATSGDCGCPS